tara:strand:+ start:961 stop:1155 length:195 start_codon:yes stop_codon:yes gene_type:complete
VFSGVSPTEIRNTWSASDMAMLERIDASNGLPDRQLILLFAGALSALGSSDSSDLFKSLFPEFG